MIALSLLTPTIPERHKSFVNLFNEISKQITYCDTVHPSLGRVELLFDDSIKFIDGGLSIGKKRQSLVKRAEGNYLAFIDDDDKIAPNYVESLLRLCQADRDVCTFRNISKLDTYWMIVDMGLHYPNDQASPMFMVRRRPWHVCPVRSHLAKMYEFEDTSYGEDWGWFEKVLKHCTTEAKTDAILHQYNHSKKHSEADKISNHVLAK